LVLSTLQVTTEVIAFQKLEKTNMCKFTSLETAVVPLFKHPYCEKYLEYWAKILHTASVHVYRHCYIFVQFGDGHPKKFW